VTGAARGSTSRGLSTGGRAVAIDTAAVVVVSLGISLAADQLLLMSTLVPCVAAAWLGARLALTRPERGCSRAAEVLFFCVCTLLGAYNDWSSVVVHRVYDYGVPHAFPALSTIPLWMLLYWGVVLRLAATLGSWSDLGPPPGPRDDVWLGRRRVRSGPLKVGVELALVVGTRQAIYRLHSDPVFSWLPFAAALVVWTLLTRPDGRDRRLVGLAVVVGPLVEMLYVQVGGLHSYRLGWLGGVPLWIVLWWALGVPIWADLSARLLRLLGRVVTPMEPVRVLGQQRRVVARVVDDHVQPEAHAPGVQGGEK